MEEWRACDIDRFNHSRRERGAQTTAFWCSVSRTHKFINTICILCLKMLFHMILWWSPRLILFLFSSCWTLWQTLFWFHSVMYFSWMALFDGLSSALVGVKEMVRVLYLPGPLLSTVRASHAPSEPSSALFVRLTENNGCLSWSHTHCSLLRSTPAVSCLGFGGVWAFVTSCLICDPPSPSCRPRPSAQMHNLKRQMLWENQRWEATAESRWEHCQTTDNKQS